MFEGEGREEECAPLPYGLGKGRDWTRGEETGRGSIMGWRMTPHTPYPHGG